MKKFSGKQKFAKFWITINLGKIIGIFSNHHIFGKVADTLGAILSKK